MLKVKTILQNVIPSGAFNLIISLRTYEAGVISFHSYLVDGAWMI